RCDPPQRYAGQPRPRVASADREDGGGDPFRSGRFAGRDRAGHRRMDEAVVVTGPVASYSWLGDLGVLDSGTLQGESAIVPGFALLSLTRATQEALKLRYLMPRPRRFRSEPV